MLYENSTNNKLKNMIKQKVFLLENDGRDKLTNENDLQFLLDEGWIVKNMIAQSISTADTYAKRGGLYVLLEKIEK